MNVNNLLNNVNMGPISSGFVTSCIDECQKDENISKVKTNIINPVIEHMVCQLQPYVIGTVIVFVFIIFITILILILLLKMNTK